MGMSLCQEKLNKGWADKYSRKENNRIMVDLAMVVRFNILAAALRVAANLFFELSICVVMSGCMCACVDSNFSKPCGS